MRVLCTGDVHIGRRSSKIPPHLDQSAFACSAAWTAIVDAAIHHDVDLIAVSGDLVDRDNRFFEALGPIERGLRRLAEHRIETVAVSGNHDFDVLPRIADQFGHDGRFRLIGRGGTWERYSVERNGRQVLHVDGWSFPTEHVYMNPLEYYRHGESGGVPVLGLLHGDLDVGDSQYAPLVLTDFARHPVGFWLLGHIHAPKLVASGDSHVLYPGSPYAMDPGERDLHGVWLVDFAPGARATTTHVALSPVVYQHLEVDLSGVRDKVECETAINDAVFEAGKKHAKSHRHGALQCASYRLRLTGRTRVHKHVSNWRQGIQDELARDVDGLSISIESIELATLPVIDLDLMAKTTGPTGEVARLLVALEADRLDAPFHDLHQATKKRLQSVQRQRWFEGLDATEPSDKEVRRYLHDQGWMLLSALVAQKEDA